MKRIDDSQNHEWQNITSRCKICEYFLFARDISLSLLDSLTFRERRVAIPGIKLKLFYQYEHERRETKIATVASRPSIVHADVTQSASQR